MSELPPYARALGIRLAGDLLCMAPGPILIGRPGFLHGGAIAGLLEMAATLVLHRALAAEPDGARRIKPVNFTASFMRGAIEEELFAEGSILRLGRTLAHVEAVAWQQDRARPVATAQAHYLLRARSRPASAA